MFHAPSNQPGFASHAREMLIGLLSYLKARLELAGAESRDALTQIGGVLLLAAIALTLTLAGYLLLCLAVVFGLAVLFSSTFSWIWIAGALGGIHMLGAWLILRGARGLLKKPMFPLSLEEFRKDESWLKSTATKPR
jgi:uncharacterized membrane protein YqjE